jgi:hypothetical protein
MGKIYREINAKLYMYTLTYPSFQTVHDDFLIFEAYALQNLFIDIKHLIKHIVELQKTHEK